MSTASEKSITERDQFEEVEHIVTIEKKSPEGRSEVHLASDRRRPPTPEFALPPRPSISREVYRNAPGPSRAIETEYRSSRSIPRTTYLSENPRKNIKMVSSRYVPRTTYTKSYVQDDIVVTRPIHTRTYYPPTITTTTSKVLNRRNNPPQSRVHFSNSRAHKSNTYSFGAKDFRTAEQERLRRERARQTVQNKYISSQINRSPERLKVYQQKVTPGVSHISYHDPLERSYSSINDPSRKGRVVNLIGKGEGQEEVKGTRKSIPSSSTVEQKNDPNVVQFSNKNGPETFTITHKTITKKSKNQNKERTTNSSKKKEIYEKLLRENEEIRNLIQNFKLNGKNSEELERRISDMIRQLQAVQAQNEDLAEKAWKSEAEAGMIRVDLENKEKTIQKLEEEIARLRVENQRLQNELREWREKAQSAIGREAFLEQQNGGQLAATQKLELAVEEWKSKAQANDLQILELAKTNSALETTKTMLQDKIRDMEREIERMNRMVSVTQSHIGGSEIGTGFGTSPPETGLIKGLNSQLAELRNQKEEMHVEIMEGRQEVQKKQSKMEKLSSKLEKLKREHKELKTERHNWDLEKENLRARLRDAQRESLQFKSEFEKEKFRADLEEEKIDSLKKRLTEAEIKVKKRWEEWETQKDDLQREKKIWEEEIRASQKKERELLELKLKNKQEFLERVLKMFKVPWNSFKSDQTGLSWEYLEEEKRLYSQILDELRSSNHLASLQSNQKSPNPNDHHSLTNEIARLKLKVETAEQDKAQALTRLEKERTDSKTEINRIRRDLESELAKAKAETERIRQDTNSEIKKNRAELERQRRENEDLVDQSRRKEFEAAKKLKEHEYQLEVVQHEKELREREIERWREKGKNRHGEARRDKDLLDEERQKNDDLESELQRERSRNKDLKSKLTSAKIREEALKQRQADIERKERELDAKEVAMAQNEDIQKLKLKLAEKEMKNVEAKRSMSVLNLGAEVQREPDMYLNQSVAGVGFDENQSYLVMNEKFRGLVELLKNKLQHLETEKARLDKKAAKYKGQNKALKEESEALKSEVQMAKTSIQVQNERVNQLKEEVKSLKAANKEMANEVEDNLSRRPISPRNSDMVTRTGFRGRGDEEKIRKLEAEAEVLRSLVEKSERKIESLKEALRRQREDFEDEEHELGRENQRLLKRLKEMTEASQSFYEMVSELNGDNLELKQALAAEIKRRKKLVKHHKKKVEHFKRLIDRMAQFFSQVEFIKDRLNISNQVGMEGEAEQGGQAMYGEPQ